MMELEQRFVAFDLHKAFVMVGAVNGLREVVLRPRRVLTAKLEAWVARHLKPTDHVVVEAGTNTWYVYDLIVGLVAHVAVANPYAVKLIGASMVKTDKRDVLVLARLLAAGLIPEVWVPPESVRQLRGLVNHRQHLIKERTRSKNRLHNLMMTHHIPPPDGDPFAAKNCAWWDTLSLNRIDRLRANHDLAIVAGCSSMIREVEAELARLSVSEAWVNDAAFLIQLPGIGLVNAMTILGAVGDVTRFPSAKKLVGYSGLGARVHASGNTHRGGGITKQGRSELRRTMVEAAWKAVETNDAWQAQFDRLADRIGRRKAITAVARKLLVVVWHVLSHHATDRHASTPAVARSLMTWGTTHRTATSLGLSRPAFVRRELDRLALGRDLDAFYYGKKRVPLPPSDSNPLESASQATA